MESSPAGSTAQDPPTELPSATRTRQDQARWGFGNLLLAVVGIAVLAVSIIRWLDEPRTLILRSHVLVTTLSAATGRTGSVSTRRTSDVMTHPPTDVVIALLVAGAALLLASVFSRRLSRLSFLGAALELGATPVEVQGQLLDAVLQKAPPDVRDDPARLVEAYETAAVGWLARIEAKAQRRGVLRRQVDWRPTAADIAKAADDALRELD